MRRGEHFIERLENDPAGVSGALLVPLAVEQGADRGADAEALRDRARHAPSDVRGSSLLQGVRADSEADAACRWDGGAMELEDEALAGMEAASVQRRDGSDRTEGSHPHRRNGQSIGA